MEFGVPNFDGFVLYENNGLLGSNLVNGESGQQTQMLNFSFSQSPEIAPFLSNQDGGLLLQNFTVRGFLHQHPPPPFNTIIGYGAFTPSQLMELENQKIIYNYISANTEVPPHLLIPLKNSLYSFGSYYLNPRRWGGVREDYDPEPGRCRRTDGKKWRCSKNAVENRKYCERHINRGRRRLRNPVVEATRVGDGS